MQRAAFLASMSLAACGAPAKDADIGDRRAAKELPRDRGAREASLWEVMADVESSGRRDVLPAAR